VRAELSLDGSVTFLDHGSKVRVRAGSSSATSRGSSRGRPCARGRLWHAQRYL